MEVRIKDNNGYVDADWTIEDGIMVVSSKVEKFEPKEGDVIIVRALYKHIVIYEESKNGDLYSFADLINDHLGLDNTPVCFENDIKEIRSATEEEKKLLFDKLKEEGYEWNAEKKEVVKIKWKPKYGGRYYYPNYEHFKFYLDWHNWDNDEIDDTLYNKGVVFKTEAECQAIVDKLNQAIEGIKP